MAVSDTCFHCALPNPPNSALAVDIAGESHAVCCPGCKAVAELIRDAGMTRYYSLRDAPQPGVGRPPEDQAEWQVFNSAEMLQAFADCDGAAAEATIYVGGMYCSACTWLIETSLANTAGVQSVDVNPITHRVRVRWLHDALGLGDVLATLSSLGYQPQPLAADSTARPEVAEQRMALKRLLVASLGMMQVMMFAVGLYAGDFQGIDGDMQRFLRLVSFFVTTPVVFYAAKPFFASAWRGVVARMPGMDLPVSIAIGAAYAASVYATFTNGPAVWFDSVVMFVFFLTLGRYLEMRARHRSIDRGAALSQLLPNTATLIRGEQRSVVPVAQLVKDDCLAIRAGDCIPADGVVVAGDTSVDEALLTGESTPRRRTVGDRLTAGSVNLDAAIEMRIERTGTDTTLGTISRMSERARFSRPAFVQVADRLASYIVIALLLIATLVAAFWYRAAPEQAFVVTLSVLVVTCPCALALATPAAFATAGSRFSQLQLLITNSNAIEVLASASHIVFDKTGTLTTGQPQIETTTVFEPGVSADECLAVATALEQSSSHPLARAFRCPTPLPGVENPTVHIGRGVSGTVAGSTWNLGRADFAFADDRDAGAVFLARDGLTIARFDIRDELRPDAVATLSALRRMGLRISLLSGDNETAVAEVAAALDVTDYHFDCTPARKLRHIEALQANGDRVVMVGDGINDAPVLAGADASVAPGHGASLAQTNADVILLGDSLRPIITALRLSRATMRVVRQNLAWAILYNATALPVAVAGLVPPWLAAIGMSASSLLVVLNALRLNRYT